jgi:glycosyltransferase involved in cell wall biosynthesis
MKFASLCILAYKRPQKLHECLESLFKTIDYPCEIIVNLDGSDQIDKDTASQLYGLYLDNKVSKLVLSNGKNRGVGRSFQNCLGVAEGDYIFKIDTDLTFEPKWLSTACKILDTNPEVGVVGLYDYHTQDPNDIRFKPEENVIQTMKTWEFEYQIVKDFVSSIYGFRHQDVYDGNGEMAQITDDGLHTEIAKWKEKKMALRHSVKNDAWGPTKSTYVSGTEDHPVKTPTYQEPFLFQKKSPDL